MAFFKTGRLILGPRRTDSRAYTQVAEDVTGATTEGNLTLEQSAGRVNARGQMPREGRRRDGDIPTCQSTQAGERDTGARANRASEHTALADRQFELFD